MGRVKRALFPFLAWFLTISGCHFLAIAAALGAIAALDLQATDEDKLFGLGFYPTFAVAGLLIASGVVVWCGWGRDEISRSTEA